MKTDRTCAGWTSDNGSSREAGSITPFQFGNVLMNIRRLTCLLVMIFPGMVTIPATLADTVTISREGSGMDGESVATVELWTGDDQIARIDGNSRMIVDLGPEMLYMVNDEARTCHAMPTRDPDQDPAALQAAVEAVEIRKTGESERIGPWQAEVYEIISGVGGGEFEMVFWITDELQVDPVQRAYMESVATPETAAMLAIFNLGGFPVRSEIQMGPVQMWTELQSIEEKPAPAGTYEIPKGYSGCE